MRIQSKEVIRHRQGKEDAMEMAHKAELAEWLDKEQYLGFYVEGEKHKVDMKKAEAKMAIAIERRAEAEESAEIAFTVGTRDAFGVVREEWDEKEGELRKVTESFADQQAELEQRKFGTESNITQLNAQLKTMKSDWAMRKLINDKAADWTYTGDSDVNFTEQDLMKAKKLAASRECYTIGGYGSTAIGQTKCYFTEEERPTFTCQKYPPEAGPYGWCYTDAQHKKGILWSNVLILRKVDLDGSRHILRPRRPQDACRLARVWCILRPSACPWRPQLRIAAIRSTPTETIVSAC